MIKRLIQAMVILVIVLLLVLVVLCTTNVGFRAGFKIASYFMPGLSAQKIEGRLLGPLTLTGFQYNTSHLKVQAQTLVFDWRPMALLEGRFALEQLTANKIIIKTTPSADVQSTPARVPVKLGSGFSLPLQLSLHSIDIKTLSYQSGQAKPIIIHQLKCDLFTQHNQLLIHYLTLKSNVAEVSLAGEVGLSRQAKTDVHGQFYNPFLKDHWHWFAKGDAQQLNYTVKSADFLHGAVELSGTASFNNIIRWQALLKIQKINPGDVWPDFKANASVKATMTGCYDQTLKTTINLNQLGGTYQLLPLSGGGSLVIDGNHYRFKQFHLSQGDNRLSLNGELSNQSDLSWQVHFKNIAAIYPEFSGQIQSQGTLTHALARPRIKTKTTIKGLESDLLSVQALTADGVLNLDLTQNSHFILNASHVYFQHHHIKLMDVAVQGTRAQHILQATLNVKDEKITFKGHGGLKNHVIDGQLQTFDVLMPNGHAWHLQKPVDVRATHQAVTVSDFDLRSQQDDGSFYGGGSWFMDKPWQFSVKAHMFEPLLLDPFLGDTFNLTAALDADIKAQGQGMQLEKSHATISFDKAHFQYTVAGSSKNLLFSKSTLNATFDMKQGLRSQLSFNTKDQQFPVKAEFALPDYRGDGLPTLNTKISAKLAISWPSLKALASSIPLVDNIQGQLQSHVNLSGTLAKPVVDERTELQHGSVDIDVYGLHYRKIHLQSEIRHNDLNAEGQLASEFRSIQKTKIANNLVSEKPILGQLHLHATTRLFDANAPYVLKIKGKAFTAINTPSYAVRLAPDLRLIVSARKETITGRILLPYVHVAPTDFTSTATVPGSFVIVRDQNQEAVLPRTLNLDVRVALGKHVEFAYAGLSADLGGALNIVSHPKRGILANGTIQVTKGRFLAYGRHLTVKKGALSYSDAPIDNPTLNVLAIKKVPVYNFGSGLPSAGGAIVMGDNIIVGVRVTGPLDDFQISLYSEPPMSQTDQLSYLLFDRPASAAGGMGLLLSQAASALTSGEISDEEIEQKTGLSTFGVQSSTVYMPGEAGPQAATSFVIGKKLTKKLEALYSIGLDMPISVAMLRYNWRPHWQFIARTSNFGQGGDVVYTYESDHLF